MKRLGAAILLICAFGLAATCACAAEKTDVRQIATLSLDFDTNVFKSFTDPEADFLGRLFYDLRIRHQIATHHALLFEYQLGAKKYFELGDQDTIINLAQLGYNYSGLKDTLIGIGGEAKFRNIADGREDFDKLTGDVFLQHWFPKGFHLRIASETTWFDHWKFDYFDYWLQRHGVTFGKRFNDAFSLGLRYHFQNKLFRVNAFNNIGTSDSVILKESTRRRIDNRHEAGIDLNWSLWLLARVSYTFQINNSNSHGDSYYNHKVVIALSKSIIDPLSVHVFGIFQYRDSLDPVLIPTTLQIEDTDENLNQITAKLAYRVVDWMSIDAKYSRFWNEYSERKGNFSKDVISLGVSFRF